LSDYSTPIDIWATGCILAELYLLHPFFKGKTEGDQIFSAFKILGSFTPE
jgi:serine/threonine protein kinase